MNQIFVYEGDFLSLLNLILYLIENKIKPFQIKTIDYNPSLFDDIIHLSVPCKEDIIDRLVDSFGTYAFQSILYVFLSDADNKELILYYFILNAIKYRQNITRMRNLKCVSEVLKIAQYVVHESHKMKGFLRFRELENKVLYAEMEPSNDILFLISPHFQKRLQNEYWIIKDVRRGIYSLYNKKNIFYVSEKEFTLHTKLLSEEEKNIENLWKLFYKTIGIKERKNERCRMHFMPKKYWKYITEVREEI